MAGLQASLRALAANGHPSLAAVMTKLNELLSDSSPGNFYATMFFAQIDVKLRALRYVSAGHEPALLLRDKARVLIPLASTGPALGVFRRAGYRESVLPLLAGDTLVAVTDGVSEAVDSSNPESYENLVLDAVRRHPGAASSDLVDDILLRVENLCPAIAPADDRTVVVVRAFMPKVVDVIQQHREAELVRRCDDLIVAR
jgi:serine phosphatase RsbU (regulator of sigma subunit)